MTCLAVCLIRAFLPVSIVGHEAHTTLDFDLGTQPTSAQLEMKNHCECAPRQTSIMRAVSSSYGRQATLLGTYRSSGS